MPTQPSWTKTAALGASAGLLLAPLAATGFGANAATLSCDDQVSGATEVSLGICEVSYTEAGTYSFTAPSGISKLSAVIIGAGGGAVNWGTDTYGGGGGSLSYVDAVDSSVDVDIEVGGGGIAALGSGAEAGAGGSSSVNDDSADGGGGATGFSGGASGIYEGYSGYWCGSGSGASAVGWSPDNTEANPVLVDGGAGATFADVVGSSTLFGLSIDTAIYSPGGAVSIFGATPAVTVEIPGAGGAARGDSVSGTDDGSADAGQDGAVYLRWANAEEPVLAATGADSALPLGAAALLLAAGAGAVIARRRSGNSA